MIQAISIINDKSEVLTLELSRPELSNIAVISVTGLGPGKANVVVTEMSTQDGATLASTRFSSRNIVLGLKFLSWNGESIEDVRQKTYKYFPVKKNVSLIIETDNRKAFISGTVESNDPTIFSNSEGTDISIICPDPFFYSIKNGGVVTTTFSGHEPKFEFPFSNESLTDNLLEIGKVELGTERNVYYAGDADTGIAITIHALGPATGIVIYNTKTGGTMKINDTKLVAIMKSGIKVGDDIVICTMQGKKTIYMIRDGQATNILNCLERDVDWFQLTPGDNLFAYTAVTGNQNLQFKIENRIVYEGV